MQAAVPFTPAGVPGRPISRSDTSSFKQSLDVEMTTSSSVATCLLLFSLLGCTTPTVEDQQASLRDREGLVIRGEPVARYIESRTAMLMNGDFQFSFARKQDDVTLNGDVESRAVAVAISDDGYFLTVNHAVHEKPALAYTYRGVHVEEPTVVKRFPEYDLAIIKVDSDILKYFELADIEYHKDEELFNEGIGTESLSRGSLLSIDEQVDEIDGAEVRFLELWTSLPLVKGNSGSPLIDRRGRLYGINRSIRTTLGALGAHHYGHAVMLDAEFLHCLIDNHRQSSKE